MINNKQNKKKLRYGITSFDLIFWRVVCVSDVFLSGGDKDTLVSSSDEDSDNASIPSNEEHKVNQWGR